MSLFMYLTPKTSLGCGKRKDFTPANFPAIYGGRIDVLQFTLRQSMHIRIFQIKILSLIEFNVSKIENRAISLFVKAFVK